MRSILLILCGLALLALFLGIARLLGGRGRAPAAIAAFVPTWLLASAYNFYVGVAHAGYSVAEEAPIFLMIYGLPVAAAVALWWRLKR